VNADWRNRYDTAIETTRRAAQIAQRYFDAALTVEWKADESPVTIADRETEAYLRQALASAFPGDGFLGEEHGEEPTSTGYRWIIDPIDGTRSFVRGIPLWGTLVGLEYQGELIAGVIDAPGLGQTWRALRGDGAYRNDRRIHVSDEATLKKSLVFYSGVNWFIQANAQDAFLELVRQTDRQRGFGDFYGFVLVAQGAGEMMVEHGVHAWDIGAIVPIIEEAGGKFSDWDGRLDLFRPDCVATNGKIHEETLRLLQSGWRR
jgi:histidinol-phosphatase